MNAPQPILPDTKIPFPCWLWKSKPMLQKGPLWLHFDNMPERFSTVADLIEAGSYTHFLSAPFTADPATFPVPDAPWADPVEANSIFTKHLSPAALPSPASLPETDDEIEVMRRSMQPDSQANVPSHYADDPRNYEPPASAEAGDWRAIVHDGINRHVAMTQAHRTWMANELCERLAPFHAPQSQSKAEAVGADWRGLVEKAQSILTDNIVPDGISNSECINRLLQLLDGPEYRAVLAASTAHPPATQNPPENAKGEGK